MFEKCEQGSRISDRAEIALISVQSKFNDLNKNSKCLENNSFARGCVGSLTSCSKQLQMVVAIVRSVTWTAHSQTRAEKTEPVFWKGAILLFTSPKKLNFKSLFGHQNISIMFSAEDIFRKRMMDEISSRNGRNVTQ
jgi:hypothetical protein